MTNRTAPNILITGSPGTGKTTLASQVSEQSSLRHVSIGELAAANNFYEGYDENYECNILDEEKVLDELEDQMAEGGNVVEYHGCDFFPERWFDIVFVLRTDNTVLFDRLTSRGYNPKKVKENVQCEIFGTLAEEARSSYKEGLIHELQSNTPDDMDQNAEKIVTWIQQFQQQTDSAMV